MQKKRVLVVDDSHVVYAELQKLLSDTEFELAAYCSSGDEAVEAYGRVMPDIVLMDIIMHGIDGLEASRRILQRWAEARIVVISALMYEEIVQTIRSIGGQGAVQKPLRRDELIDVMRKALE